MKIGFYILYITCTRGMLVKSPEVSRHVSQQDDHIPPNERLGFIKEEYSLLHSIYEKYIYSIHLHHCNTLVCAVCSNDSVKW